jgi:invasion protein IalB
VPANASGQNRIKWLDKIMLPIFKRRSMLAAACALLPLAAIATAAAQTATAPAPAAPQRTETINYENWVVTCRDTVDGAAKSKKLCTALLRVADKEHKNVVFAWLIGRNAAGVLMSVVEVPTGVLIQKGVELKVGNGKPRLLAYTSCAAQACEASIVTDDAFSKELIAGQTEPVTAIITAVTGQTINFNFPIKGIDKAIGSIGR